MAFESVTVSININHTTCGHPHSVTKGKHTHTRLEVAQQMKRQGHDGTGGTEKRPWVKQTTAAETESERMKERERDGESDG